MAFVIHLTSAGRIDGGSVASRATSNDADLGLKLLLGGHSCSAQQTGENFTLQFEVGFEMK